MTDLIRSLLPWVVPPILGAIIGYVTNSLAIKMLFRPYTEKRFLGLRVPLTPGIIPKQRYHLAESIGRMVSKELLTEDALLSQIRSPDFTQTIEENISAITSKVLDTPVTALTLSRNAGESDTAGKLIDIIEDIVKSDGFTSLVSLLMGRAFEFAGNLTLADLNAHAAAVEKFIDDILSSISTGSLHERAVTSVSKWLDERIEQNDLIGDYLGDRQVEWICGILESAYEPLLNLILTWAERPKTKELIADRAKVLLKDILNKLNLFQKLLISAGQYDRTLQENMGDIVEDALRALKRIAHDPKTRTGMIDSIRHELVGLRKKRFSEILDGREGQVKDSLSQAIGGFFDFLGRESTRKGIARIIVPTLDSLEEKHIKDILSGIVDIEALAGFASNLVVSKIRGALTNVVNDGTPKWIEALGPESRDLTIRRALGITDDIDTRISENATRAVIRILEQRAPKILDGFDVYGMVVNKINGLDVVSVEGLLLRVIERHLKWINVFGALLGAIIGFIQILMRIFEF